jgi:hypothetical protein
MVNNKKSEKMTIDKLAIMMNDNFGRLEDKMATKDDLKNLEKRIEAKMATKDTVQIMLKEITAIHADTKSFRENISSLYTDHLAYDKKIDNILVRVEKVELKSK